METSYQKLKLAEVISYPSTIMSLAFTKVCRLDDMYNEEIEVNFNRNRIYKPIKAKSPWSLLT